MCGIFGYKGKTPNASGILLHGLERLEYRGYDSAGLWVSDHTSDQCIKSIGKVSFLAQKVSEQLDTSKKYTMGIAHTRWATHGGITEDNTHPHHSMNKQFFLVHNGIIENYYKLKQELISQGYTFYGETDSEVVANLLAREWTGNFLETVQKTIHLLRGAYALLIVCKDAPEEIIGVKIGSPLLFGYNANNEFFFSSDKQALAGYVDKVTYLEDGELVHITGEDYTILNSNDVVKKDRESVDADNLQASKGEYKHFMLKEIYEQAAIINRIFKGRIHFTDATLNAEAFNQMQEEDFEKIVFVGCGTSYNAGRLGTYWMQDIAGIDASCEIASEMEYKSYDVSPKTLYVFVSQSGETADSIQVLKDIMQKGGKTFGIVNVPGSSISRLTNYGLFTRAGAEIGVASTKAFTAQLTCILMLALFLGKRRKLSIGRYTKIITELEKIPSYIESLLANTNDVQNVAKELSKYKNFFFLGKHYHLPIAAESSLKCKEITYLHSEAYPSGELKHGPLAMIEEALPSIIFMPHDDVYEKNMSALHEIQSRKGKVLTVSNDAVQGSNRHLNIPKTIDELYPFVSVIVGQLLSYYMADTLGKDIDKPRNLAKSVTVK